MNLQLIKAIIVLPGSALVYVSRCDSLVRGRIWGGYGSGRGRTAEVLVALVLGTSGLALAVWTTSLFRTVGEGTPAPWAPPKKLVVRGPYRHVRNPMITSVLLMLGAESLFFGSWHNAPQRTDSG